jgi:hypothetical protein
MAAAMFLVARLVGIATGIKGMRLAIGSRQLENSNQHSAFCTQD